MEPHAKSCHSSDNTCKLFIISLFVSVFDMFVDLNMSNDISYDTENWINTSANNKSSITHFFNY